MRDFHTKYLALTDEIENTYPVARWSFNDVPVWPLVRNELYIDMYWQNAGKIEPERQDDRHRSASLNLLQTAAFAATPLINVWRSRSDLSHMLPVPRRAYALFLGDAGSLDHVDGAWLDRFCEPLISAFERKDVSTCLMQRGDLRRLPWKRPSFAANTIERWGQLYAGARAPRGTVSLPKHSELIDFVQKRGAPTRSLTESAVRRRAAVVTSTASMFEWILKRVQPSICFMVKHYVGLGPALSLACRRRGVLSVDLQHDPQDGRHEAYTWQAVPDEGYSVLPAVFWNWSEADARAIDKWTKRLPNPWHRSFYGGHPQLPSWFDNENPQTFAFDAMIADVRGRISADREILVALQTLDGYDEIWNALAALIERSPTHWRWWLRRHPAAPAASNSGLRNLLAIRRPNVLIEEASTPPLPALLRHMDLTVSLKSGVAVEASMFGVPSIFLSPDASEMFPSLLDAGQADIVVEPTAIERKIAVISRKQPTTLEHPSLPDLLTKLNAVAAEYSALCTAEHSNDTGIVAPRQH